MGLSKFLGKENMVLYTNDADIFNTIINMKHIFEKERMHLPNRIGIQIHPALKKQMMQVYDIILKHFKWEKDSKETIDSKDIAINLIVRERLKNLYFLWSQA